MAKIDLESVVRNGPQSFEKGKRHLMNMLIMEGIKEELEILGKKGNKTKR